MLQQSLTRGPRWTVKRETPRKALAGAAVAALRDAGERLRRRAAAEGSGAGRQRDGLLGGLGRVGESPAVWVQGRCFGLE